ncbi:uncharacterized protein YvpB [Salirhabdus euzebyi]|uniref:Uncharacterized protein YvpB n=1 Tax=Salirhabdus euzebyi TaxID=394506 RepID=A0A841Q3V3_9BACI|nr:C39 family peptidase [Salirhabdus euzebyi]MBB6453086.1 uncharacterized protein YvpB [Salirhabdus euzebyi]
MTNKGLIIAIFSSLLVTGCNTHESQPVKQPTPKKENADPSAEQPLNTRSTPLQTKDEGYHEQIIKEQTELARNHSIELYGLKKTEKTDSEEKEYTAEHASGTYRVTIEANLRKGPGNSFPSIITIDKNTKLEVYEKANVSHANWFHVEYADDAGWVSSSVLEKIESEEQIITITAENIEYIAEEHIENLEISVDAGNVRTGPDLSYPKITTLTQYRMLEAFEKTSVNGMTWYHVNFNGQTGWVASIVVNKYDPNRKFTLISAPLIAQMPQLPRGCEVTSLAMLLGHAGVHVDKMTLASEIKRDPTPYQEKDGNIYFGNPHTGFVGNMYTFDQPGLGVYHRPIAELGEKYLPGRIVDLTGNSFEAVYEQLDNGKPVWVINTSWFAYVPDEYWETWNTPTGTIRVTKKEHSVLVTGYDENYIYFNDPLAVQKHKKVNKSSFIAGWNQMGNQAITYN